MQLERVRPTRDFLPRLLVLVGFCSLSVAELPADELPAPEPPVNDAPMTDQSPGAVAQPPTSEQPITVDSSNVAAPDTVQPITVNSTNPAPTGAASNSQNSDNPQTPNTDNTGNGASAPNVPAPGDTTNPNTPLLPSQGLNTSPLYSSPDGNGAQPSQLTAPALYNTGAFDLSQVAANNALAQAFMQTGTVSSEQASDGGPGPMDRIRIGPLDVKTNITLSVVADDNINADATRRVSDTIFTVTPSVLINYGSHEGQRGYASVVYAPTFNWFYHNSAQDSQNQNASINLQYPFQRLALDANGTYAETTGINLDSRTRTTQTSTDVTAGGSYDIDDKLQLQVHGSQLNTSYSGNDSGTGSSNNSGLQGDSRTALDTAASYRLTEKLNLGPGFTIGVEKPEGSARQTFEQALLHVTYQVTEKLNFFGQGGVEWRHYSGGFDSTNPVFNGGINYTPTLASAFSVSGYQNVEPTSDNSSQTDVNTGLNVSASERLFQRYVLAFSFIYSHTEYSANGGTTTPVRNVANNGNNGNNGFFNANGASQDNLVYRPSLTFMATQWTNVAIYYQYQGSTSSTQGGGYYDNQFGLSVSAQF
jgi:hypothetical protein